MRGRVCAKPRSNACAAKRRLTRRIRCPRRLEELNEQRLSQVQRLKLVEKDREGLDGAKAEAEAFIAKETELARCRCTLFQLFLTEASANVAKIEANKAELEAKLEHERCVLGCVFGFGFGFCSTR